MRAVDAAEEEPVDRHRVGDARADEHRRVQRAEDRGEHEERDERAARAAEERARRRLPRVGLAALGGGGLQRLARSLPLKHAMDLVLTGRRIGSEEAKRIGLVNEVVPRADLKRRVREIAGTIVEGAPLAVEASKQVMLQSLAIADLETAIRTRLVRGDIPDVVSLNGNFTFGEIASSGVWHDFAAAPDAWDIAPGIQDVLDTLGTYQPGEHNGLPFAANASGIASAARVRRARGMASFLPWLASLLRRG